MGRVDYQSKYSLDCPNELSATFAGIGKDALAEKLEALVIELKNAHSADVKSSSSEPNLFAVARSQYSARRSVDKIFDHEGFSTSPGWDVMLDLYQSEEAGKRISVTSACIGAACPPTTGLRWIQALEAMGYIARISDPLDKRRSFVQLTSKGRAATEKALEVYCA